jgi:hypothetical protein
MATPFDPGYGNAPFVSLVEDCPGDAVYPRADFRVEWGPVFHRGRLDGSARLLVIGQDPAQHELIVRRILVGTAGKRVQGFMHRLGMVRSYVCINAFLYSVYGQGGGNRHIDDASIADHRHRWIGAILDTSPIEAVVTFGGLAKAAWQAWLAAPPAQGRPALPFAALKHPTWPESSSNTAAQRAAATQALLENWNAGLAQLHAALLHPDSVTPLTAYGTAFQPSDMPDIPLADLPAGTPAWMATEDAWATRSGDTPKDKRRTIVVKAPASQVP